MSFSWDIKKKLCEILPDCPYCRRSELAGIIGFSGDFTEDRLKLLTGHQMLADRIKEDIKECIGFDVQITGEKSKRILIEDKSVLENLRAYLFLDDEGDALFESEMLDLDCCRASYIRGAFLSGGCVLDPKRSYHLEFDTKYRRSAGRMEKLLTEMGFPVKITYRKGHHLVYAKELEAIADILGLIGAGGGALTVYSVQVEKEMRNSINRQVNCDTANANKLAAASLKQRTAILKIKNEYGLEYLPDNLRELAELRLENPDESLQTLGEMLSKPIGKSGVNHRMNRIIEVAENL